MSDLYPETGVALFGPAILPGQYLSGRLVPLLASTHEIALGLDGVGLGCDLSDYQKSQTDVLGNIVLVRRGDCTFQQKAEAAELAGAIACVVVGTGLGSEYKTITMDFIGGIAGPSGVGVLTAMVPEKEAMVLLAEMRARQNPASTGEEQEDECTSFRGFCAPVRLVGEMPPISDSDKRRNAKVLQFNNQPIENLLVINAVQRRMKHWNGTPKQSLLDPRRRLRAGLLDVGQRLSCLGRSVKRMDVCCSCVL